MNLFRISEDLFEFLAVLIQESKEESTTLPAYPTEIED